MDRQRLQRYELAVYLILVCLAALLAIIGNSIPQETLKAITINLASELLAVGVLFFIVKQIFLIGEEDNFTELKGDLKTLENLGLDLGRVEAENKAELNKIAECLRKLEQGNIRADSGNREALRKIANDISRLGSLVSTNDPNKVLEQLSKIRPDLQDVSRNTSELVSQVTKEVDVRQKELLASIERRFSDEVSKSHGILAKAIERELNSFANQPNAKDLILERLVSLVDNAMGKMGDFQRTSIREESKTAFSNIERSIRKPISDIAMEVQEIKKRVDQLALPPAKD